jgi:hypothetical protein
MKKIIFNTLLLCATCTTLFSCKKEENKERPKLSFNSDTISLGNDTIKMDLIANDSNDYFNYKIKIHATRGYYEILTLSYKLKTSVTVLKKDTTMGVTNINTVRIINDSTGFVKTNFNEIQPFNSDIYTVLNFKLPKGTGKHEWFFFITDNGKHDSDTLHLTKYVRMIY